MLYSDKRLVSLPLSALNNLPSSALCGCKSMNFAAVQLEHGGETLGLKITELVAG